MTIKRDDHLTGHLPCLRVGNHGCNEPSGRTCLDCERPAGTFWGPYWCPDCDSRRMERISRNLEQIARDLT